ncbi:MAG: insulinase family protein [Nibricoccus sp.]
MFSFRHISRHCLDVSLLVLGFILLGFQRGSLLAADRTEEERTSLITFENGPRIIVAPAQTPGEVTLMLYACGGSADEAAEHSGASKLLAAVWAQERDELTKAGGRDLATFANPDFVYASSSWPSDKLQEAFDFMIAHFIVVHGDDFEAARKTTIDERARMNERWAKMSDLLVNAAFAEHPYRRPAFGPENALENLPLSTFRKHVGRALAPHNLIIVLAGDVDATQVDALAQMQLSAYKSTSRRSTTTPVEPPQSAEKIVRVERHDRPMFLIGLHKGPGASDDIEAWGIIGNVLQKRIMARLSDRAAMIRRVSCLEGPAMRDPNLLIVYGSFKPEMNIDQARDETLAELKRLADEGVAETELRAAQAELAPSEDKPETTIEIARDLADWLMMTGDWRHHYRYQTNTRAVTLEKINALVRSTFRRENLTSVIAKME